MEVRLSEHTTIKQARRAMRHSGYRLTVRNGRIYTIRATETVQPGSKKQKECQKILNEANKLADKDLKRRGRKEYWQRKAEKEGYKTARGCCRAHYIRAIKNKQTYATIAKVLTYNRKKHDKIKKHEEIRFGNCKSDKRDNHKGYDTTRCPVGRIIIWRHTSSKKRSKIPHQKQESHNAL